MSGWISASHARGIDLKDHILQLRNHIRHRDPAIHRQGDGQYLDLVAYWQDLYQKAQSECDRLRIINTKLERSNHLLSNLANIPSNTSIDIATATSKRKAPSAAVVRPPKRSKAPFQSLGEQSTAAAQETINNDFEFLDGLGEGMRSTPPYDLLLILL